MGVGDLRDVLVAVDNGFDMFDCVMPTRNAATAHFLRSRGRISIKTHGIQGDPSPLDPDCGCYTCELFEAFPQAPLLVERDTFDAAQHYPITCFSIILF